MRKHDCVGIVFVVAVFFCISLVFVGFEVRSWFSSREASAVPVIRGNVSQIACNNSNHKIDVLFWSNYCAYAPLGGEFSPGARKIVFGSKIQWIPQETIVFWTVEGEVQEHRQAISLHDIPRNIAGGVIVFQLNRDNMWSVFYKRSVQSSLYDSADSSDVVLDDNMDMSQTN